MRIIPEEWKRLIHNARGQHDPRMIFVEGPSGAGKTTLVDYLEEVLAWPRYKTWLDQRGEGNIVHSSSLDITLATIFVLDFLRQVDGFNVICDRSYITSIVYDEDGRRTGRSKTEAFRRLLREVPSLFLFIDAPSEVLVEAGRELREDLERRRMRYLRCADMLVDWDVPVVRLHRTGSLYEEA